MSGDLDSQAPLDRDNKLKTTASTQRGKPIHRNPTQRSLPVDTDIASRDFFGIESTRTPSTNLAAYLPQPGSALGKTDTFDFIAGRKND
jgi:hypothetical protein